VGTCRYCDKTGKTISDVIGFCVDCIRSHFDQVWPQIATVHARSRKAYGLPVEPPQDPEGISCDLCMNQCRIGEGQAGFCGLRHVQGGRLKGGRPHEGNLSFYHDPLPTNCMANFVCPGGTGCGSPRYTHKKGPEHGYANLARKKKRDQILRICWETNGSVTVPYLNMMARVALESGGSIKVDLKAWDEGLHQALCGVTNKGTLANFRALSAWAARRPEPPFLIASTLLVPGYVDEKEVDSIARFIGALNPDIPYSLLGFYPRFCLDDLPVTSRRHAARCEAVAREAGLKRVHIGNMHLLQNGY